MSTDRRLRHRPSTAADLRALVGAPPEQLLPQLEPEDDLRTIVISLMEALQVERTRFDAYDPTGRLRRSYERFACDLRESGFHFLEGDVRRDRALRERRLGELAERRGFPDAAILHYARAVAAWPPIGCRRRLALLERQQLVVR